MIRAMTIREPHISRIMEGRKTIEVRQSRHPWTGAIGEMVFLHGSARPDGPHAGHIVGATEILDVRPFSRSDMAAACLSEFRPGMWAVVLGDVIPVDRLPARGQLGLWRPPPGP